MVYDLKGQSVWFNQQFMEYTNRTKEDYLKPNFVDTLLITNPDHPYTEFFINLLQDQPPTARGFSFVFSNF